VGRRRSLIPPRKARWAALVACLAGAAIATARAADEPSLEIAVKATYLYKFAPFVEWPASAFDSPSSPLTLCVVRSDPFGIALDRAVAGQRVGERPIVVRRLQAPDRSARCHIMYVGPLPGSSPGDVLSEVRGRPVLTVTDAERDPRSKGVINFVVDSNRIRFEIDDAAAAEQGLMISSKLLGLAVAVRTRPS